MGIIYLEMGLWDKAIESFKMHFPMFCMKLPTRRFSIWNSLSWKGKLREGHNILSGCEKHETEYGSTSVVDLYMGMTYYAQGNCEMPFNIQGNTEGRALISGIPLLVRAVLY